MRILALDPGGTTGWTSYDDDGGKVPAWGWGQLEEEDHHVQLYDLLDRQQPDVVVCERFTYRPHLPHAVLISRDYIGVATLWCKQNGVEIVMQMPAHAKGLWDDKKLKAVNLYQVNKRHANDATRHLLYYLTINIGDQTFIKKAAGK